MLILRSRRDLTREGAYVAAVGDKSAAKEAGVQVGDIVTKVDGQKVKTVAELQEKISRFRPGDKVKITIDRNKSEKELTVTLKNMQGDTDVVKSYDPKVLGAQLVPLSDSAKRSLGINYGLQVKEVTKGGKFHQAGIPKGCIILRVNNSYVSTTADVEKAIKQLKDSEEKALFISGILPNGKFVYYAVDMNS